MPDYEKVCPEHGHYKASLGSCPICRAEGGLPIEPLSFRDEDNLSTQVGGRGGGGGGAHRGSEDFENMETQMPHGKKSRGEYNPDEEGTVIPKRGDSDGTGTILRSKEKIVSVEVILWMRKGPRRGKIFQIKDQDTIGRAEKNSRTHHYLESGGVSAEHAKITCEDGKYYIWDLASKNGTYVNGERIYGRTIINENDIVTIDEIEFVVKILN